MQNLNQLFFKSSASQSADVIHLHRGLVSLFKRSGSNQWQCRFRLPNCQWHSMSTGQADLEEAKHTSIALYEQTMAKISQELSLKSKSFKQLAEEDLVVDFVTSGTVRADAYVTKSGLSLVTITDFVHSEDKIDLSSSIFTGAFNTSGCLDSTLFATDTWSNSSRVCYNSSTGALAFDQDGSGTSYSATTFAVLSNKPTGLSASDFVVI
ncbi:phage integrase family protein [beta proteobacterium CB]|uniref:phage integrase family protein n=1 Tax=Polynucleobacter sp. MWH-HuK1 TaxID=1743158 RepID=UPI0002B837E5|nr:phage integrase family protein [Polynucleobacter sp. MWH-HuK1]AGG34164.1 phage integrase family protein [beta proteobacterium CB]AGG34216.1 phage integrase family protein [beta proteobacterium CB]MBU3565245.1 integrase [Polynucleobacter sp. MWH-HuK1]